MVLPGPPLSAHYRGLIQATSTMLHSQMLRKADFARGFLKPTLRVKYVLTFLGYEFVAELYCLKFPTAPLYQVNERVYLVVPGRSQPAGPYLVKAILENKRYKLKREDNGQELRDSVEEDDLVVQVAELT